MLTVGRPLSVYPTANATQNSSVQMNTVQNTSALAASRPAARVTGGLEGSEATGESSDSATESNTESSSATETTQRLDEVELALIKDLASRDREVRTHEQAHAAIGGAHAGSPSYSYTRGPDGKQYATGGEVQIDVSAVEGDPEATIEKMRQVARAALAPAEPSAADRAVAAAATQTIAQAQSELSSSEDDEVTAKERSNAVTESDETEAAPQSQQNFVSRAGIEAYRSIFAAA